MIRQLTIYLTNPCKTRVCCIWCRVWRQNFVSSAGKFSLTIDNSVFRVRKKNPSLCLLWHLWSFLAVCNSFCFAFEKEVKTEWSSKTLTSCFVVWHPRARAIFLFDNNNAVRENIPPLQQQQPLRTTTHPIQQCVCFTIWFIPQSEMGALWPHGRAAIVHSFGFQRAIGYRIR